MQWTMATLHGRTARIQHVWPPEAGFVTNSLQKFEHMFSVDR
jgi:hypothetical protein